MKNASCHGCEMTDRGSPCPNEHGGVTCWAMTELMATGGKLLIGDRKDMARSRERIKSKLTGDAVGEYSGPPVDTFDACTNVQKRLVCYHKLYRYLYGVGIAGVRVALPSCCVLRIQNEYRDLENPACHEESYIEDTFKDGLYDI